jgi:hypothetical protein
MELDDEYDISKMSLNQLFRELKDATQKLQRLTELKAPEILIEYQRIRFDTVMNELLKYMSLSGIENEMQTKWLNRKWRDKELYGED